MKSKKIGLLILSGLVIASCSKSVPYKETAEIKEKIVPVKTMTLEKKSFQKEITIMAETEGIRELTLSAALGGNVDFINEELGQRFEKGEIVAKISTDLYKEQYLVAESNYKNAERTYLRQKSLYDKKLISEQAYEDVQNSYTALRSQWKIADINLKNAILRAPFSGYISGVYTRKDEFAAPGAPLLDIVDLSAIVVQLGLSQDDVYEVYIGQNVLVKLPALRRTAEGKITHINVSSNSKSKTYTVTVRLENPNGDIRSGLLAEVNVQTTLVPDAIAIRQDYVIEKGNKHSVFVVREGKAFEQKVTVGFIRDDQVLITEGLTAGDVVIIEGQGVVEPGQKVAVTNE